MLNCALNFSIERIEAPTEHSRGRGILEVDGKTFADLAAAQGRTAGLNESFGDMKLVPMLEIRLPAVGANLPPQSALTPYNISVQNLVADGSQKVAYIPLSIVTDEQSGQRVAFTARMNYLPTGAWPNAHNVRLAWVLQMLTDLPCDRKNAQDVANGCAADNYIHNAPQVVQTYYDDFTLTGLNVSEQHSAKTALIYEDPAVDPNKKDDVALTALSHGLDQSFLSARDADNNGVRDVDINEIARRFERTSNSGVSSEQRWGLDAPATNILKVERHDYPSFDQAAIFTAMTDTVGILNSKFNAAWASDNTLKPTIAYAYETQSRAMGLDESPINGNRGYVRLSPNGVAIDMQPVAWAPIELNTMVELKWTHYCRTGSSWDICAGDTYWSELDSRYAANPLPSEATDPEAAAGSIIILQLYNLQLSKGLNRVVQRGSQLISGQFANENDAQTAAYVRAGLGIGAAAVTFLVNEAMLARINDIAFKRQLSNTVNPLLKGLNTTRNILANFKQNRAKGSLIVLATLGTIAGLAVLGTYVAKGNIEAKITLKVLVIGLQTAISVADPIYQTAQWASALRAAGGSGSSILIEASEALQTTRQANAVGALLAVGVVWGFFIYSMAHCSVWHPI